MATIAHYSSCYLFYANTCLAGDEPPLELEGSPALLEASQRMAWPSPLHTTVGDLRVRLWLPPDLDPNEVIKYPLLITLYVR